ncbi:MAG TPA: flagellar basal body-associated FliL family protein [Candidatus Sulfotelmatobacter sp.]
MKISSALAFAFPDKTTEIARADFYVEEHSGVNEQFADRQNCPEPHPSVFFQRSPNCFCPPVSEANQVAQMMLEKQSRKRSAIIIGIMLLILGIWYWTDRENQAAGPETETNSGVKTTLHLDTFVLNLADRDQQSYLRVGVDLGIGREMKHGEDAPVARLRDIILNVLSKEKADDLLRPDGKEKLKGDLGQALRERVPGMDVQEVYFTELLIQR